MWAIPAARSYDWAGYCGVPGGIPERTVVRTSLTPSNTLAEINAACADADKSGQVVQLGAGTYSIGAITLLQYSGYTLRGAGPGQTIIDTTATSAAIISTQTGFSNPHTGNTQAIASGYTAGSKAIVLSSTPPAAYIAGNLLQITQDDDYDLVWHRTGNWAGSRNLRFSTRIVSVVGNTINLATPIPYTYQAALSPQAQAIAPGPSLVGIEEMSIVGDGAAQCLRLYSPDRCWLKNVEMEGSTDPIQVYDGVQCEFRQNYFHDVDGFPDQSDGYGLRLDYGTCNSLVVDNIGYHLAFLILQNSASANVIIDNYDYYNGRIQASGVRLWVMPSVNCNHGPHGLMNLYEANIFHRFQNDGYHGSASHNVLYRNSIHGVHPTCTGERQLIDLCRASYYHTLVGNVLGDDSWTPDAYEMSGSQGHDYGCIYQLGYPNVDSTSLTEETAFENWTASYPDAQVASTLFRHANYDFYNEDIVYEDGEDTDIPDSLFYTTKPSYYGDLTWPCVEPVGGVVNDNPAKSRWDAYALSADLDDLFGEQTATPPEEEEDADMDELELEMDLRTESTVKVQASRKRISGSVGDTLTWLVWVKAVGSYTGSVDLAVEGLPTGAVATFGKTTVLPGEITTLTITTTGVSEAVHSFRVVPTAHA